MKKLYTFLFLAVASLTMNAQTTETFNNFDTSSQPDSYIDGTFVGEGGITWTYNQARSTNTLTEEGPYDIEGRGLLLRRPSTSYLEGSFPNGLGTLTFQYRKAFTGGSVRQLEVLVNGVVAATTAEYGSGTGDQPTVYTQTVTINQTGAVTVKIKNTSDLDQNRQSTLDNITWTAATANVKDNAISGLKMFPNPLTGSVLNITSNNNDVKTVAIFDVLGKQVVNTKTTTGTVNVANLSSGVYMVKITEAGKTSTRKLVVK